MKKHQIASATYVSWASLVASSHRRHWTVFFFGLFVCFLFQMIHLRWERIPMMNIDQNFRLATIHRFMASIYLFICITFDVMYFGYLNKDLDFKIGSHSFPKIISHTAVNTTVGYSTLVVLFKFLKLKLRL